MESNDNLNEILYVLDFTGRLWCGEIIEENDITVVLNNPLVVVENQVAPDKVASGMQPFLFSLHIESIELKWAGKIMPDQAAINRYKDILVQIRAAKSNIQLASSVPANPTNPIHVRPS